MIEAEKLKATGGWGGGKIFWKEGEEEFSSLG